MCAMTAACPAPMHAATLANSDRLQRVASLLADGQEHSTMEIVTQARVCAVNSVIAELRVNGIEVVCRRAGNVWYYRQVNVGRRAAFDAGPLGGGDIYAPEESC